MDKMGYKLRTTVRGYMFGNSVLGENMHDEEEHKVFRGAMDSCRDEYALDSGSTIMRITSQPEDVGRVLMKSMDMEFHGCPGMGSCFNKL
jgi:hypothetical protein